MKLKTQFIIGAALLIAILVGMAVFVTVTRVQLAALANQHQMADSLQRQVNDLAYLSNNYLLYREPEQKARWDGVFATFVASLDRLRSSNVHESALIDTIRSDSERLHQVFEEVASALVASGPDPSGNESLLQVSWSRMEIQDREIVFSASRLERSLEARTDRANLVSQAAILATMVVFGVILLGGYFFTYRRTVSGIAALSVGTEVVGSGNLDYSIPVDRKDEIGQLSLAFNRMTGDLKSVTASKAELENEVAERKQAEAEREQLLTQTKDLADSLALSNELLHAQNADLRVAEEETARLLAERSDMFRQLQTALVHVPKELPGIAIGHVYRSATKEAEVGGDFYDVFEAMDGRIGVLIGDVSGHGIEAARIATLVKDTVYAFAYQSRRPHLVLYKTNQVLLQKGQPGFVTAFLGFLDHNTGALKYASAGHPPPLVAASGAQVFLESSGLPLGVFPHAYYQDRATTLAPGSILLLYTDGVTDARRGQDRFGEEGLVQSVSEVATLEAKTLPSLVLADALRFSGQRLDDDVALLAVGYGPADGE